MTKNPRPKKTTPRSTGSPPAATPRTPSGNSDWTRDDYSLAPASPAPSPLVAPTRMLRVIGASEHNLKHISVDIPRNAFTVITGLSGSGKSSLAFDTIYAEGQRRYVESLSSYARQFLDQMQKPQVDHIEGLSPAISIEQKSVSKNPRSTVGTVTEIYDYLRVLYATAGHPHCPECGLPLEAQTAQQIVDHILAMPEGTRLLVLAPVVRGRKGEYGALFDAALRDGFTRAVVDGAVADLERPPKLNKKLKHDVSIVIDRVVVRGDMRQRLTDSVELALRTSVARAPAGEHAVGGLVSIRTVARGAGRGEAGQRPAPQSAGRGEAGQRPAPQSVGRAEAGQRPAPQSVGRAEAGQRPAPQSVGRAEAGRRPAPQEAGGTPAPQDEGDLGDEQIFSEKMACPDHGPQLVELTPRMFSFNSPYGACPRCKGLGTMLEVDESLIVAEPEFSINEGAVIPWQSFFVTAAGTPLRTESSAWNAQKIRSLCAAFKIDMDKPFGKMSAAHRRLLLHGSGAKQFRVHYASRKGSTYEGDQEWEGVIPEIERRWSETESDEAREYYQQFFNNLACSECGGSRLKPESRAVTVLDRSISQFCALTVAEAMAFLKDAQLSARETEIARQPLKEIRERLEFLANVGLGYLTLDRTARTLAGGEAQRIRLATQIGSQLVGVLYILDEPSIGLHHRDNRRLLATLKRLRDMGNTVIVVEHDEETIRSADFVVDLGPGAGRLGGEVVAAGTPAEIEANPASLTGRFLSGAETIPVPAASERRRPEAGREIVVVGATEHNLRGIDVTFPLGVLVCVTGVSGSGKSTLVNDILFNALSQHFYESAETPGAHREIRGLDQIDKVINVDQSPIGRTPRSNPATYAGLFGPIRDLFSRLPDSNIRGYKPGRFSFNVKGGRCETCQGDGLIKIEMHFLPDVYVECEACHGRRFNRETLEVRYRSRNIADVLEMTVEEALDFFENIPVVREKLQTLFDVGLGYIHLGQSATTLSGGEAQRVKLARELSKRNTGRTLYLLDEPTTGLHFADIRKLLEVLNRLVAVGSTVVVIEHNLDVIKTADWILDLGPEGGAEGGLVVAQGSPEAVAKVANSYTGRFLRDVLRDGLTNP